MTYIPFAPELGAFYTITGPDGTIATFNKATDANYCGVLSDISGLDSANVNDSSADLTQSDGGYVGTQFYGRRPITLSVQMFGYPDIATRNAQMAKIRAATNAMSADGTLSFLGQAAGAVQMATTFRRQQPVRFTGGWVKTCNIALTSQIAPLLSSPATVVTPASASITVENQGDYAKGYINTITVQGPTAGAITVTNTTTGGLIKFLTGLTVASGHSLIINPQQHTATVDGASVNQFIDYVNSTWVTMPKGNSTFTTNTGTIGINFNSAWV